MGQIPNWLSQKNGSAPSSVRCAFGAFLRESWESFCENPGIPLGEFWEGFGRVLRALWESSGDTLAELADSFCCRELAGANWECMVLERLTFNAKLGRLDV